MHDECIILARSAQETRKTGASLSSTIYELPITVGLTGELGSGKTTFLQAFAEAIGVSETLTSPTYALERQYETPRYPLLHLDLYRLTGRQAAKLLRGSEDCPGIRCIEWFDRCCPFDKSGSDKPAANMSRRNRSECARSSLLRRTESLISIAMDDASAPERCIRCRFHDVVLPTMEQIIAWRSDAMLPGHIIDHCEAVAAFAMELSERLIAGGRIVRRQALRRAAQIHDLFRFLDFRPGGHPDSHTSPQAQYAHEGIRARYPGLHHELACAAFLREQGFIVLSSIVAVHGLAFPPSRDATVEQKLLFYADKRVLLDRVVSLEERFADFAQRYGKGAVGDESSKWYEMTKRVEKELFPYGPPN